MEFTNLYQEDEKHLVGLHDCKTTHIDYSNHQLSFIFPEGFMVLKDDEWQKSGIAKMSCYIPFEDELTIYLYKEKDGITTREDWTDRFIEAINQGIFEFEFITAYKSYWTNLYKGVVWFEDEPYHYECEIEFHTDRILYEWNEGKS